MEQNHADRELKAFRQFLSARQIVESADSLSKRPVGEPDLLFRHPDGSMIAYELCELLDEAYAATTALLFSTKTALRKHFKGLQLDRRRMFKRKYGDALLSFQFSQGTTLQRRLKSFPLAFERLLALPDDITGDVLENEPQLAGILRSVSVSRGIVGPIFDPESTTWIGDPTVSKIRQKFEKSYTSLHPIELLAYIDGNPMLPDDVWLGAAKEFVDSQPRPLPFRRVWIFDCRKGEIRFDFPGD